MLLAALAGEHVLLIGPPGTAKSLLARRLRLAFREAIFFERLLTQFSVPEDLFGPYSLEDLDKGRYRRLTEGYLADADVGFLDEIFKANPSILNALLTLLNERVFHNVPPLDQDGKSTGDAPLPLPVPLKCLVGASNEVPEPGELDALYDRFLIRCEVGPVVDFQKLLQSGSEDEPNIDGELAFAADELTSIRKAAKAVDVPQQVDDLLEVLRYRMAELMLDVSDRRWLKIRKLLQVAAYTSDREQVSPLDVLLVPHCVWSPRQEKQTAMPSPAERKSTEEEPAAETPIQVRNGLTTWVLERMWEALPTQPGLLDRQIAAWEKELQKLAQTPPEDRDPQAIKNQQNSVNELAQTTMAMHQFLNEEEDRFQSEKHQKNPQHSEPQSDADVEHCEWGQLWFRAKETARALEKLGQAVRLAEQMKVRIEVVSDAFHQLVEDASVAIAPPEPVVSRSQACSTHGGGRVSPDPYDFGHSPQEAMIVAPRYQQDWATFLAAHPAVQSSTRDVTHTFQKNRYATPWAIEFMLIPPGEFINEDGESINIELPFLLSKYPITRQQWQLAAIGPDPWAPRHVGDRLPAYPLTHADGIMFCQRLNGIRGLNGTGYRHPTSDEWEYACRAGTATNHWYGDQFDKLKTCADKHERKNQDRFVYLKASVVDATENAANPFGLCGMHGNVYELCADKSSEHCTARGGFFGTPGKSSWKCTKAQTRLYSSHTISVSKTQRSLEEPWYDDGSGGVTTDAIGLRIALTVEYRDW